MEYTFRIFDFNVTSEKNTEKDLEQSDNSREERPVYVDDDKFLIQIFGKDENGKTCSIIVEDFKPFFYVLVDDNWTKTTKDSFLSLSNLKLVNIMKILLLIVLLLKEKNYMDSIVGENINLLNLSFRVLKLLIRLKIYGILIIIKDINYLKMVWFLIKQKHIYMNQIYLLYCVYFI